MVFRFRDLAPEQHQEIAASLQSRVLKLQQDWLNLRFDEFRSGISNLDGRLHCERLSPTNDWILSYDELAAIPLAEWLASQMTRRPRLLVGRPPGSYAEALTAARKFGVDLSSSRVRVGFTRGHLLEVYVLIPREIDGSQEDLQIAVEVFLETFMGDRVLDVWVAQVAVDRIGRTQGLIMVADSARGSESYPLVDTSTLIQRGISGLLGELPLTLLDARPEVADWSALSIEEPVGAVDDLSPQEDRRHISTRFPEAIKSSLIGLPFSSSRFTRGDEILVWFSWVASPKDRTSFRQKVEAVFERALSEARACPGSLGYVLAGTGFGSSRDFVDVWVRPDARILRSLGQELSELTGQVSLGFYDSIWRDEAIDFKS